MADLIKIVNAPSKFDLMTALFVWKPTQPTVQFTSDKGTVYTAQIMQCGAEDGSGESWIVDGKVITIREFGQPEKRCAPLSKSFNGWYRTSNRKGWIKIAQD